MKEIPHAAVLNSSYGILDTCILDTGSLDDEHWM
jgi:hypothetical protein